MEYEYGMAEQWAHGNWPNFKDEEDAIWQLKKKFGMNATKAEEIVNKLKREKALYELKLDIHEGVLKEIQALGLQNLNIIDDETDMPANASDDEIHALNRKAAPKGTTKGNPERLKETRLQEGTSVANTIVQQMGGMGKLRAMLGAKLIAMSNGLRIIFPNRHRTRGNVCEITLEANDTYTMKFFNASRGQAKLVQKYDDIYFDQLIPTFEKQTGWYLRMEEALKEFTEARVRCQECNSTFSLEAISEKHRCPQCESRFIAMNEDLYDADKCQQCGHDLDSRDRCMGCGKNQMKCQCAPKMAGAEDYYSDFEESSLPWAVGKQGRFLCPKCGAQIAGYSEYQEHYKRLHGGEIDETMLADLMAQKSKLEKILSRNKDDFKVKRQLQDIKRRLQAINIGYGQTIGYKGMYEQERWIGMREQRPALGGMGITMPPENHELQEDREFVVWGVPPGKTDEEPLYTKAKSKQEADKVCATLEKKHGCKKCRVQAIDMSIPPEQDWKNMFKEQEDAIGDEQTNIATWWEGGDIKKGWIIQDLGNALKVRTKDGKVYAVPKSKIQEQGSQDAEAVAREMLKAGKSDADVRNALEFKFNLGASDTDKILDKVKLQMGKLREQKDDAILKQIDKLRDEVHNLQTKPSKDAWKDYQEIQKKMDKIRKLETQLHMNESKRRVASFKKLMDKK